MSYDRLGVDTPSDPTCTYGASRLLFRGPARSFDRPYLACLGGTETFGRFVETPFPAILEQRSGRTCVNLGSVSYGLEAMARDAALAKLANGADCCVIQLPGAQTLSNPFYRVHPRRNDRVLEPSEALKKLFPKVDFTEIHFSRHLLTRLRDQDAARFDSVRQELRRAWAERMREFLAVIAPPVVLLWLRYESGPEEDAGEQLAAEPLLLDADLVAQVTGLCDALVEVPVRASAESDELEDMLFGVLQQPLAEHLIGPATHRVIADRLHRVLMDLA
ncbi:hypothetical protein FGK63_18645 [Ruegeria sediminis]|uniref:DUF6473 domain-containing protein n=1 Tax=Ruegeria sediminis TaxID=2583820 RepID=A0ABY2WSL4_9RHOB|nr:DUF6473 family protein [Ruegeria sediminis]TMV03689.1 hypothetical protein FGK63_18645 [Ruegeria sediminis]